MATVFEQEVAENLGNIPFVYYGSYQIDVQNINFFTLYYKGSLPCLRISFYDTLNLMKDTAMPLDDSKIKIFLNPRSEQLKEILLQFKITSFVVNDRLYMLEGIIDVNYLFIGNYTSYPDMTSYEVLQEICKKAGLGFNTNIDNTNDKMTWINPAYAFHEFIDEVIESSYKSDNSFIVGYVDYYYNFNFIDIEKELERNIDQQLSITDNSLKNIVKSLNPEKVTNLIISNDDSFRETNLFFDSYKIINNSTNISLESGYNNRIVYYNTSGSKNLLDFHMDSITSQDGSSIILKGQPQDNEFYTLNTNTHYLGKIDSDNSHKNFQYSWIQNEKNIFDLEKFGIEVNMRTPNFSIYKFQKIKVFISNQASTPSASLKNSRLTGDWLVTDISYTYIDGVFSQTLKLVRRELSLSQEELAEEIKTSNRTKGENNSNEPQDNNEDEVVTPPSGNTSNNTSDPIEDISSILTKEIWRKIYSGKVKPQIIELMYEPVVSSMEKYEINTKERIAAYLSQVNTETGFLRAVTEYGSGERYNNNKNLGNGPNDGPKYKGRGLIQVTGRNNYKKAGQYLKKDFINDPESVAAENKVHLAGGASDEQKQNAVQSSIWYWLRGSAWGNLNKYADQMDINKQLRPSVTPPKSQSEAKKRGFKVRKKDNFALDVDPSDENLYNFTLISFGVNGGYNGFSERIDNWNEIRKYLV